MKTISLGRSSLASSRLALDKIAEARREPDNRGTGLANEAPESDRAHCRLNRTGAFAQRSAPTRWISLGKSGTGCLKPPGENACLRAPAFAGSTAAEHRHRAG